MSRWGRPMQKKLTLLVLVFYASYACPPDSLPAELNVPEDFSTIQRAVDAARDGDTVVVAPGNYFLDRAIEINPEHDPDDPSSPLLKNITLKSSGDADNTVLTIREPKSPDRASVVVVDKGESSDTVIEGFTFSGGQGAALRTNDLVVGGGGALVYRSDATFISCVFTNNSCRVASGRGGGVFCWESKSRFVNCHFFRNFADGVGGGIFVGGEGTSSRLERCLIEWNEARGGGGAAVTTAADATFTDTTVSHNMGGGILLQGGPTVWLSECVVSNNDRSGIACHPGATIEVTGTDISGNKSDRGAGILLQGTAAIILDSRIRDNVSADVGGGILVEDPAGNCDCSMTLGDSEIFGNIATRGAGIAVRSVSVDISGCSVHENTASQAGGGILLENTSPDISSTSIERNASLEGGGGLRVVASSPTLREVSIVRNIASSRGGGLGIFDHSTVTMSDSRLEANAAFDDGDSEDGQLNWGGGGVFIDDGTSGVFRRVRFLANHGRMGGGLSARDGALAVLENCLFAANSAVDQGGALFLFGGVDATINHCTFAQNVAKSLSAVACAFSNPTITNSIVWGHDDRGCVGMTRTLTREDPEFVLVGSHDFTRFESVEFLNGFVGIPDFIDESGDYRLRRSSPAIDAGLRLEGVLDGDLGGSARLCGDAPDLGAFERCDEKQTFRRGFIDRDSRIALNDAVFLLRYLFLAEDPPTCMKSADVDDGGKVDLSDAVVVLEHLFLSGPPPSEPFSNCGVDTTADELGCEGQTVCEASIESEFGRKGKNRKGGSDGHLDDS